MCWVRALPPDSPVKDASDHSSNYLLRLSHLLQAPALTCPDSQTASFGEWPPAVLPCVAYGFS